MRPRCLGQSIEHRSSHSTVTRSAHHRDSETAERVLQHWHDAVPNDRIAHLVKDTTRAFLRSLQVRLAENEEVDLPWTDAYTGFDDVEAMANHLRARQLIRGEGQALQQSADAATAAARAAAAAAPGRDPELVRELNRLRKGALAPDLPKAAPRK